MTNQPVVNTNLNAILPQQDQVKTGAFVNADLTDKAASCMANCSGHCSGG